MIDISKILPGLVVDVERLRRADIDPGTWTMKDMMYAVLEVGRSFDPRFVIDEHNRSLYENVVYWVMNDRRMKAKNPKTGHQVSGRLDRGLCICGQTGTGKTTAMQIVARFYDLNRFKSDGKTMLWVAKRSDEIADRYAQTGNLDEYKDLPLLCIEDVGSEQRGTMYMGNKVNVIQKLIEYRGDRRNKMTCMTSNFPLGNPVFTEMYGDRAVSRMVEMMNYLVLIGPDRRMENNSK